jgi:hypothetical protein
MADSDPFNLSAFMLSHFNRVDFGGNLFGQWPVGIRFDIGQEQVSRAVKLYEFIFGKTEDCILVSQDWPSDEPLAERFTPLFRTPGVFPNAPSHFQSVEISPVDESLYRLTWTRLPPLAFDASVMFQAIANRERGGTPSIASGVYTIDPHSKIIMHMYDDRGLDVIATDGVALLPLYKSFGDWVLDEQRHRVAFRFRNTPNESLQ